MCVCTTTWNILYAVIYKRVAWYVLYTVPFCYSIVCVFLTNLRKGTPTAGLKVGRFPQTLVVQKYVTNSLKYSAFHILRLCWECDSVARKMHAQRFYLNLLPVLGFLHHSTDLDEQDKPVTSVFLISQHRKSYKPSKNGAICASAYLLYAKRFYLQR